MHTALNAPFTSGGAVFLSRLREDEREGEYKDRGDDCDEEVEYDWEEELNEEDMVVAGGTF